MGVRYSYNWNLPVVLQILKAAFAKILGTETLEGDCQLPIATENDDSAIGTSGPEDILSPCNNRCGKKTLFPMVFGYQEPKSPRSPLGTVNLNTNFMVSI